jgi:acylphosphatase
MAATRVVVHGRVQGVFFRASCAQVAESAGVCGWVANADDGTVEAWFEGEDEAVEAMVRWCHTGPPRARVQRVESEPADPVGHPGFEVR